MNKRIKELAIQAGFFYEDYKDIWYLEYHNETCEEEMKKFAELIVQRTLAIVEAHTEIFQSAEARAMVEHIKQSVKTDFGVKE